MLFLFLAIVILFTLACTLFAPSQPQPTAIPSVVENHQEFGYKYSVEEIAQRIEKDTVKIATPRFIWNGILAGLGFFFLALAGVSYFTDSGGTIFLISATVGIVIGLITIGNPTPKVHELNKALVNTGITEGIDYAKKAQATNLQYIAATVKEVGSDQVACKETVNVHDFCSSNTPYYSTDTRYNCQPVYCTDDDGNRTKCGEDCDTLYTPWFQYIERWWEVPNTKGKYLHPELYDMEFPGGDANAYGPKIFISDWRAPQDAENHLLENWYFGFNKSYNNKVPASILEVRAAQANGIATITHYYVGKYFHWLLADEAINMSVYEGHLRNLQTLVPSLPSPKGARFEYTNGYGKKDVMWTLLYSDDGQDLPTKLDPVFFIGYESINPVLQQELTARAQEFQGHFGPNKQAIAYWYYINDEVVQQMGGLQNVTQALLAQVRDTQTWGLFQIPKNQVLIVESTTPDMTFITGRDAEMGMPLGNTLVKQRMRLSIEAGQQVPFTWQSAMGNFASRYTAGGFEFSDMTQAGSVIGLLYEQTPGYEAPSPDTEECNIAPAEHLGFVRYEMCTQAYRKTTIKVNAEGADLIFRNNEQAAKKSSSLLFGGIMLTFGLFLIGAKWFSENS